MLKTLTLVLVFSIILGFFNKNLEKRLFWLFLIVVLLFTKEYFQICFGVPMRLFSASLLERVFGLFNIQSITDSSILVFENSITQVDYPCSGSLTLYYSLFFSFIICFIKNLNLTFYFCFNFFVICLVSVYLNILRIFILISLNLAHLSYISDKIHGFLGIVNYILICLLFLFLVCKINKAESKNYLSRIVLVFFFIILSTLFFNRIKSPSVNSNFEIIKDKTKQNLDFTKQEILYYQKNGSKIEKYKQDSKIVIRIVSNSPLALHNPLICLKNQGFRIIESKTVVDKKGYKKRLKTNKGIVYYYFIDKDRSTDDYYKIAFLSLFDNKKRTLVIEYMICSD